MNAHATRGQTALMWAVSQQHADVVAVLLAHGADLSARSDVWSQVMAVPPHGYLPYNKTIPAGGETALLFAARVGDLASAKLLVARRRQRERRRCLGRQRRHAGRALGVHRSGRVPARAARRSERRADRLHRAARGDHAPRRAHGRRTPRARRRRRTPRFETWTPTRRSSDDFNFAPELVGATPFWLAARFIRAGRDAAACEARRRSAVRAPRRTRRRGPGRGVRTPEGCDDGGDGCGGDGRRQGLGSAGRAPSAKR